MKASDLLEKVRSQKPLIHHITNWVTIYDCANIVKVLGASPVMAHAPEEVSEMTGIASALVLNIGTLTAELICSMKIAALAANKKNIPVVLDVCGAGATKFRDDKIVELLDQTKINIIKGNASEIARVAGMDVNTKGVDSGKVDTDLTLLAQKLAEQRDCTVVITGKVDIITSKNKNFKVKNGNEIMSHVVGTGCMAASVIGTFAAVGDDLAEAACAGLCVYAIAAEQAVKLASGPGTFKQRLFDCLFCLDSATVDAKQRIE
ncbi:MAG: hydroxyethylthiazole kinase [Candidatus Omnitrophica bacterium]|nr:hydroxyethylthiazole kinase [Candidatus Omnitrophota bacterium]